MVERSRFRFRPIVGGLDRRTFLKASAGASTLLVVQTAFDIDVLAQEEEGNPLATGFQFFVTPQAETIAAMAERIWPATEESPGATEAGVVYYIDHALAGEYRRFQGDYRNGIQRINDLALSELDAVFVDLSAEQQQSLLERIEAGELETVERAEEQQGLEPPAPSTRDVEPQPAQDDQAQEGEAAQAAGDGEEPAPAMHQAAGASTAVAAQPPVGALAGTRGPEVAGLTPPQDASLLAFFDLVYAHTMEGLFSDPIYGGNRDFAGWRAVYYPGAYYVYTEEEQQSFEPLNKPIQSIADI